MMLLQFFKFYFNIRYRTYRHGFKYEESDHLLTPFKQMSDKPVFILDTDVLNRAVWLSTPCPVI